MLEVVLTISGRRIVESGNCINRAVLLRMMILPLRYLLMIRTVWLLSTLRIVVTRVLTVSLTR